MKNNIFIEAKPIWIKNKRKTKNLQVGFRCDFIASISDQYVLKVTGATTYRIFLNGKFIAYGPARAGHGYIRYDEIILDVKDGNNTLAIEVAGYNCASFYTLDKESFLCAEIYENGDVLACTGKDFEALSLDKLRNIYVQRYSYQRTYSEIWNYDLTDEIFNWATAADLPYEKTTLFEICDEVISRQLPLPEYQIVDVVKRDEIGHIEHISKDITDGIRYISNTSNHSAGYAKSDLIGLPICELYGKFIAEKYDQNCVATELLNDRYVIYSLPTNNTGFIINNICALEDSEVYVFFSEYNYGDGLIFESLEGQTNLIKYNLKKNDGIYNLESFEPYTCKCIGVAVTKGRVIVQPPGMREYSYPLYKNTEFEASDETLVSIFNAAVNTFRQNTLDVFMDCPGRERAGWLCDSYFTAQSERMFAGNNLVEKVFLENFIMAKEFPNIPTGMLPMNYPSEVLKYNGGYIPQWAMWYVIELEEYIYKRTGEAVEKYRTLCYELLDWFIQYENEDGMLESMPGWNFIEWSKANDWVMDVNYPTNMLYAKMLSDMANLFHDNALKKKSDAIKNKVIEEAFKNNLFTDNAVRKNKELQLTNNHSETCQYYAYFTDTAVSKDEFSKLTDMVMNIFGPKRKQTKALSDVEFSNAFIGNYLRLIILLRNRKFDNVIEDIKGYFSRMAEMTGTLWEYDDLEQAKKYGSLNHGFASFAGVALVMATAGISDIDYVKKQIIIDKEYRAEFDYCIKINTDDGQILLSQQNQMRTISLPDGWGLK